MHTSPLAQPGTGDAGGMNVYVLQSALQMARRGVEVEIFTRATSSADQPTVRVAPGVLVRNVVAGPFEGLDKYDLPTQLCAFTAGVLRAEANHEPGYYDIVHSHYWLSGQVGWLARDRWAVPLVHTAHTLAAVKNAALADGDSPEPPLRAVGEQQVVDEADRLIANTEHEAQQLVSLHHADPARIDVVHPGVDLQTFTPGDQRAARAALGLDADELVLAFVGRIQPLKAPDVLLRAAARLTMGALPPQAGGPPARGGRFGALRVLVAGGPSGTGLAAPDTLVRLAAELGVSDRVTFLPPQLPRTAGQRVPRRRPRRGAELLRIVRTGRRRGPGLRHAGGGSRGRWAAGRGSRWRHRHAGARTRRRRLGQGDRRTGGAGTRHDEPRRRRARRHVLLGAHRRRAAGQLWAGDQRLRRPPSAQRAGLTAQRQAVHHAAGRAHVSSDERLARGGTSPPKGRGRVDNGEPLAREEAGSIQRLIEDTLKAHDLTYSHHEGAHGGLPGLVVELPGERRLKTNTILTIGEHSVRIEAFVCRKPDENNEGVYRFLLKRNRRLYGVAYTLDNVGDIYLVGRMALHSVTADEIDRVLGQVLEAVDADFNTLLELGFRSSIQKEWAWRVSRGESLKNLRAFEHLIDDDDNDPRGPG